MNVVVRTQVMAFLCLFLIQTSVFGQSRELFPLDSANFTQTARVEYLKPSTFFSGDQAYPEIPELDVINTKNIGMMEHLSRSMELKGISVGITKANLLGPTNQTAFFNLYDPSSFSFSLSVPPFNYGLVDDTYAGRLNFLTHDPVHLDVGIFAPRLKDILNEEGQVDPAKVKLVRDRLSRFCLLNEALTTAFTFAYHVKFYWSYRNAIANAGNAEQIREFDSLNRGVVSFANIAPADQLDLMLLHVEGKIWDHAKLVKSKIDFDSYKKTRAAGVPIIFPSLDKYLTPTGEKLLFKYGFSTLITLAAYYAPSAGYNSLLSYSKLQAQFYTEPWFVEWADRFNIGQGLNEWEAGFWKKAGQFRKGQYLTDVEKPADGVFTTMAVKNAMAQLGRKVIELRTLMQKNPGYYQPQDIQDAESMIQKLSSQTKYLNDLGTRNQPITGPILALAKSQLEQAMIFAEARFPISKYIPSVFRLGQADYYSFWKDATAVVLPRPEEMVNFPSNKDVWKAAQLQRMQTAKAKVFSKKPAEVDLTKTPKDMAEWVEQLAAVYNKNRKGDILEIRSNESDAYLRKLDDFKNLIIDQVEKVVNPQIVEFSQLSYEEKIKVVQTLEAYKEELATKIDEFKGQYRALFIEGGASSEVKAQLFSNEANIKDAADFGILEIATIIEKLNENAKFKTIEKSLTYLTHIAKSIKENKEIRASKSALIDMFIPFKTGRVRSFCSAIARVCFKQELTDVINSFNQKALFRNGNKEFSIVDRNSSKASTKKALGVEKNAVIVFVMNHDHSMAELQLVQKFNDKLGIKKLMMLTTKKAWPHLQRTTNKDERILLIEDDFKQQVIERVNKNTSEVTSVTIFPEGRVATFNAQMPLISKYGAFKLARELAVKYKGVRPVYLVNLRNNILDSITSEKSTGIKIEVLNPILVPTHEIGKNDAWMETQRVNFQTLANEGRAQNQTDLVNVQKIPKSGLYITDKVSAYQDLNDSLRSSSEKSCAQMLQ